MSKALQRTLQKANAYAAATPAGAATAIIRTGTAIPGSSVRSGFGAGKATVSGTASSVAFTPMQVSPVSEIYLTFMFLSFREENDEAMTSPNWEDRFRSAFVLETLWVVLFFLPV
jgi:hypothetical protein